MYIQIEICTHRQGQRGGLVHQDTPKPDFDAKPEAKLKIRNCPNTGPKFDDSNQSCSNLIKKPWTCNTKIVGFI